MIYICQALAHAIPDVVIWRGKSKFWESSSSGTALTHFANSKVSDDEFSRERSLVPAGELHSKEEYLY